MGAGAAPELPALGEILAAAFLFIAWGVCLGVLWAYRRSLKRVIVGFAKLINVSVIGRHPLGGVSSWLKAQADNIDHLLGEAALASERGAVVLFKLFLNLQVWIGHEIADLATDTWHGLLAARAYAKSHVAAFAGTALHFVIRKVEATAARFEHYVAHRLELAWKKTAHLATAIAHDVGIAAKREGARSGITSKQLRRLARRLDKLEKQTVGLGAVALVTAAALRMGFKWIKCDAAKSVGRRLNCGSFRFLESLLSLVVDSLVITHLCATTKLLTRLAYDVLPLVSKLTHGVEKLMECQKATPVPHLTLQAADLPALDKSLITL